MIIVMMKGKIHCLKTPGDKNKSQEDLMAAEAEYYINALAGAAQRFDKKASQKTYIDKIAAMAKAKL